MAREAWVHELLVTADDERQSGILERRIRNAKLGRFKPIADFDWDWPKQVETRPRGNVLRLGFLDEPENASPNGAGKTISRCNIAYQALLDGPVRRATASGDDERPGRARID